jgi:hypothetical protein
MLIALRAKARPRSGAARCALRASSVAVALNARGRHQGGELMAQGGQEQRPGRLAGTALAVLSASAAIAFLAARTLMLPIQGRLPRPCQH